MKSAVRSPDRRPRGFALIITIVLVAFLVLILVGLATFTRVETQVADNSQQLAKARQNALLALNIAVGQLQKHTGPDQRVTATADLQPLPYDDLSSSSRTVDPASGADFTAANPASTIDTYWRASRNPHWTGAWKNENTRTYSATDTGTTAVRENPRLFNPEPVLQSWLVSGNEHVASGDDFKPTDAVSGLSLNSTALDPILDASGRPYRLLVKASAGVQSTSDPADPHALSRVVTAPQVALTSDQVPGFTDARAIGHYAWWVGDEGVKTRANLLDPYHDVAGPEAARTRFQSAQRPAVEVIDDDLAALDPESHSSDYATYGNLLGRVLQTSQLGFLDNSAAFQTEFKQRYHEIGIVSRGVLADTKNGGLKSDLTYLFGQANDSDFRTALRLAYGTNDVAPDAGANRIFTPASTLYATLPPDESRPYSGANGIFSQGATWEQLWSFANQGASFNGSGELVPRRQTSGQHGAYPLIIQCKLYYRLRIVGGAAVPPPAGDGVNRTGVIHVDVMPLAVLANPYAVPLEAADYHLRISGAGARLVFGSTDNTGTPSTDFTPANSGKEPDYTGDVRFVLRSPRIGAGEALVFTIDPSANSGMDAEDRLLLTGSTDRRMVVMKNDYDPVPALTFNTGLSIPSDETRVAMWSSAGQINSDLYMDYDPDEGDRRLVQFVRGQNYNNTADLGTNKDENRFLIVNPIQDGVRQGGGYNLIINQAPIKDVTTSLIPQQAIFAQVNYRGMTVHWSGSDSTGLTHTVEWARTFSKNGSTGSAGDAPNPWFAANLLHRSGDFTKVRWGLVNIGEKQEQTVPPESIGGAGADDIAYANHLYDVPRPGRALSSMGQLQHFNVAGYIPATDFDDGVHTYPTKVNSWQMNYSVSNSYPHPRILRENVFQFLAQNGYHFDGSYLWNDLLWDRFFFSTYPQSGSFDFAAANDRLINSRLRPFRDRALVEWDEAENFRGDGSASTAANNRIAAKNLLLEGAFNINSTSVGAWKALFASLRNLDVGMKSGTTGPFARTYVPTGGATNTQTATHVDSWTGFRDLTDAQLEDLAEEMVLQVRQRGPFLSLSQFVNRRLVPGRTRNADTDANDPLRQGLAGALQTAIDRVTNSKDEISAPFNVQAKSFVTTNTNNVLHNSMRDPDYRMSSALAGFPGYLLQADLLSALGPTLSARSDTFTIRTYGDSVNPATGEVTGQAWCEAVVQRLPDYVRPETQAGGNAATDISGLHADNQKFGRRYQIVSFRWLSPEDI